MVEHTNESQRPQLAPDEGDGNWRDMGNYWLNVHPSNKGIISYNRKWGPKKLLTASNFAAAAGFSSYLTRRELAREFITGIRTPVSRERREAMSRGREMEGTLREIYSSRTGMKVELPGLMVPKFDVRIGAVVDGLVGEVILEIKTTSRFTPQLLDETLTYRERIRPEHYAQIQGEMAIMGLKFCDYLICSVENGSYFCMRIPYDSEYWENELYPQICSFFTEELGSTSGAVIPNDM